MVVLLFQSEDVRRACCDLAWMRRLWGPGVARRISRRLQQLEAMTTLADLAFLPFDFHKHENGVIEVAVDDQLAVFIKQGSDALKGETGMRMLTITGLRARSRMARTS